MTANQGAVMSVRRHHRMRRIVRVMLGVVSVVGADTDDRENHCRDGDTRGQHLRCPGRRDNRRPAAAHPRGVANQSR